MTHLGAFGEEHEAVDITFDYFGATFHANPDLSDIEFVEFLNVAGGIDVNDLASLGIVKDFARLCISADDFDGFWATVRKNRQSVGDVFEVLMALVEATVERPTGRSSDSADGPGNTGSRSEAADSSPALRLLQGRPDLQAFVKEAAG